MKSILLPLCFLLAHPIYLLGNEGIRVTKKSITYSFTLEHNKLVLKETKVLKKLITDLEKVNQYDVRENVFYNEFERITSINAHTKVLNKKRYKKVPVTSFPEVDYKSSGIFYSGTKRKLVDYPSINLGSRTYLKVKKKYLKPELMPSFYFTESRKIDTSELVIIIPDYVDVGISEFLFDYEDKIKFEKTIEDGKTIYKWTAIDLEKNVYESNDLGSSCRYPHIIFRVKSFDVDGQSFPVFRDLDDLFTWYSSLIEKHSIDSMYRPLVDSLNTSKKSNEEKAEAILQWVQHNIKYIAYEDGMGGFVPRNPNQVLENRYGDCKDMSMLTKTLMNECGLECNVAWVGTRSKCYSYHSTPSPAVDNHMIAVVPNDTGYLFLDATNRFLTFGDPSPFIQGKEVLVYDSKDTYSVVNVPFVEPQRNVNSDTIYVSIDNHQIHGEGIKRVKGYKKIDFEYQYSHNDEPDNLFFKDVLRFGNKSFQLIDVKSENLNSNSGDILLNYSYTLSNFTQTFDNELYLRPFLKAILDVNFLNRETAFQNPYKYKNEVTIVINTNDAEKIVSNISTTKISELDFEFQVDVKKMNNQLWLTYSFVNKSEVIYPTDFEMYSQFLKKVRKITKQQITISNEN